MKVIRPVTVTGSILASSSVAEADYPEWSAAATYALGDRVIKAATHRVYESVIADNIDHDPESSLESAWVDAGPTNRWAMFDSAGGPRTVDAGPIVVELVPTAPLSSLGLLDVGAASVRVQVLVGGVAIYDQVNASAATNLSFLDLPAVAGQHIRVTVTAVVGANATVGKLVIGDAVEVGRTQDGPTSSIIDYSRRETDEFGVTTVVERSWARRVTARCRLDSDAVDGVQQFFAEIRGGPVMWIGNEGFEALTLFGNFKDFSVDLQLGTTSFCSLTIEGLPSADVAFVLPDPAVQGESDLLVIPPVIVTDAILTASNVPENDAPQWQVGNLYQAGDRVVWSQTHRVYESLIPGNTGQEPTNASAWLDVGPTNRWAMFDQALGTATERATSITITLTPGTPVQALAVLDSNAASVRVQAGAYDRIRAVAAEARGRSITFLDLDVAAGVAITVTISAAAAGETISVGTLLFGALLPLGKTEDTPTIGITDYSRKDTDDFGNTVTVERAWAKRMDVKSLVRTDAVDPLTRAMASVRAKPALWIGHEDFDSLTVYGFFKDFTATLSKRTTGCSFTIEGLSKADKVVEVDDAIVLVVVYQNAAERPAAPAFNTEQVPAGWSAAPMDLPPGQYRWATQAEFRGSEQRTAWTTPVAVAGINLADLNRGAWAPGVTYHTGEFLQYGGSSYIVIKDHVSAAGLPPPNQFVSLLASAGAPGEPGEPGTPGTPGAPGATGEAAITPSLTSPAQQVWAYANGVVKSYDGATTTFVLKQGGVDISANFNVVIASNPNGLQVSLSGRTATVVGATANAGEFGNQSVLSATLTLRATGTGAYIGRNFDLNFTLGKLLGGYEIVSALPTTNNFEGRMVYLTTDDKLYRYTGSAWTSAVAAGDISGGINATQFASGIEPVTIATGSLPTTKSTSAIAFNGKLYRWNGTAYVSTVDTADLLGQIAATQITDGSVSTPKLAAGAVTTAKLAVVPESLIPDPYFVDTAWWTGTQYNASGWYFENNNGSSNGAWQMGVPRVCALAPQANVRKHCWSSGITYSGQNQTLRLRACGTNGTNDTMYVNVRFFGSTGATTGDINLAFTAGIGTNVLLTKQMAVPTGTTYFQVIIYNEGNVAGNGYMWCSGIKLDLAASAEVIVDGQVTTAKLDADSVTAAKIAAGAVGASEIAAGVVSTDKLVVQTSGNLLFGAHPTANPRNCFFNAFTTSGVTFDTNYNGNWPIMSPIYGWATDAQWTLPDRSTMAIRQSNELTSNYNAYTDVMFKYAIDTSGNGDTKIAIVAGQNYEWSVYTGAHRCNLNMYIQWLDSSGNHITYSNSGASSQNNQEMAGGSVLANYKRQFVRAVAPSNAAFAQVFVRKGTTVAGGGDSWMFFTHPQFAAAAPNASVLMDYVQPAMTLINGTGLITGTVYTDAIAAGQVTTDKLAVGAVTAAKIAVTELSAITSTIGLLRTATTGRRCEIDNNGMRSYDSNGTLRTRGGVWTVS